MTDKLVDYVEKNYRQDPITKKVERVACYIRVSSQEQKLHGISLDAQRDKLKEYAKKNGLKIVEWYEDEGVSGRKLIRKRPELQRMLNDAHAGKFDRILFIKLDRFFRSVAEYHECMKFIDPVIWTATEEKYDLSTANGRAFVNMKLTIAELEADQTGERIKIVNEYKVKTGQAMTGAHKQGLGFTVQKIDGIKKVVRDPETEELVRDTLNHFLTYQNKRLALLYINEKYDQNITYRMIDALLTNTKLYGYHRGNSEYCESYISKSDFEKIQNILNNNIRFSPRKNIFIFTGLIKCPVCGGRLTGSASGHGIMSYRCTKYSRERKCTYNKRPNESKLEAQLLTRLNNYITTSITEVSVTDNSTENNTDHINKKIASVKSEIAKVKRMYRKDDITEAEYDQDMSELKSELKELESKLAPIKERDLTIYNELLNSDWITLYNALNKENKRAFWRKYIKEIQVDDERNISDVIFF